MENTAPNPVISPPPTNQRPISVTVFGVLNIIFGFYFLVRMIYDFSKHPNTLLEMGILGSILIFISFGFIIWLIVLGIGLLTMRRWARRGCVLYGWIQVVLIVIMLSGIFIDSILARKDAPRILLASMTLDNALSVVHWIYMILLLIVMKSQKVKQAFAAIGG
jgi:hypothetical protein